MSVLHTNKPQTSIVSIRQKYSGVKSGQMFRDFKNNGIFGEVWQGYAKKDVILRKRII